MNSIPLGQRSGYGQVKGLRFCVSVSASHAAGAYYSVYDRTAANQTRILQDENYIGIKAARDNRMRVGSREQRPPREASCRDQSLNPKP